MCLVLVNLKPIISLLIPAFPTWFLVVLKNIAFALFILGTFYALLSGNLKSLVKSTKLFAFLQIVEVIFVFVTESFKINTSGMCLFLAFYSLSYLLGYMTRDTDPSLDVEEEVKKPKKEKVKKEKKDKKANDSKKEVAEDVTEEVKETSSEETVE